MKWLKSFFQLIADSRAVIGEPSTNFTPRAQQALVLARHEADRLKQNFIGTHHLLLGLVRLGQGVAVNVLQKMCLTLHDLRQEIEKQMEAGSDEVATSNSSFTPRVKKVIALARNEATALHHTCVGTEHILLGILREGGGVAAKVLHARGIEYEKARQEILKELDPNIDPGAAPGKPQ